MFYKWLLVAALVGATFADHHTEEDCCSTEDKQEIEWSWNRVWKSTYTERKVKIMRAVIDDVFDKNPDAKALVASKGLTDENSPLFRAYLIRMAHQFDLVINLLDDPAVLEEHLGYLADRFGTKVNLKKHYFAAIADAMERVLPEVSSCFNIGAWNRCMRRLSNVLTAKVAAP
jgi:hypothetical protein